LNKISHIILMSQNRLREFLKNSGVKVTQVNSENDYSISNSGYSISNSNSNSNSVSNSNSLTFTPLKYLNFNATIEYNRRPNNVLQFVKNTKPRNDNYVKEISAIYDGIKSGAVHTSKYGFKLHQNVNSNNAKKLKWSAIQFSLTNEKGETVIVRFYENKILMFGAMVGDPLNIAKYIVKTYFKQDAEFVNNIKYTKIDAGFKFNATFSPLAVSQFLVSKKIEHFYEPELWSGASEIKDIKYKGIVINSIVLSGFVRLHNAESKKQMERMYALAKEFIQKLKNNNLLTMTNAPPATPQKKRKRNNVNVTTPENIRLKRVARSPGNRTRQRITRLRNNTPILLNGVLCSEYKFDYIKKLSKKMGVQGKVGWKKEDYCKAIYEKAQNVAMDRVETVENIGKNNIIVRNELYRKKGVDNASIRNILGNNRAIQYVRTSKLIKKDKRGVPTKTTVEKVANVIRAAQTELNRFNNINANTRKTILNKVKNVNTINKAVKIVLQNVRRAQIYRLTNLTTNEKNTIYKDLKNKKNVNVNSYSRKYKLVKNYNATNSVKNKVINWMKNKKTLPTNENLMNKLRSYAR